MKRFLTLLLTLSLFTGLAAPTIGAAADNSITTSGAASTLRLEKIDGSEATLKNASDVELKTSTRMRLFSGYTLSTRTATYAYVGLDDTKAIKLDSSSASEVIEAGKKLEMRLSSGRMFFNVTAPVPANESFQLRTATMVAGVRGTCGWVEIIDRYTAQITLLEGSLEVVSVDPLTGNRRSVTIYGGQTATVVYHGELHNFNSEIIVEENQPSQNVQGSPAEVDLKFDPHDEVFQGNFVYHGDPAIPENITIEKHIQSGVITQPEIMYRDTGLTVEWLKEADIPASVLVELGEDSKLMDKLEAGGVFDMEELEALIRQAPQQLKREEQKAIRQEEELLRQLEELEAEDVHPLFEEKVIEEDVEEEDEEEYIPPAPVYYTLSVNYLTEDSTVIMSDAAQALEEGSAYSAPEEDLTELGYYYLRTDGDPAEGIMDSDKTVNHIYTPIPTYTLTVNHQAFDGGAEPTVFQTDTAQVKEGDTYTTEQSTNADYTFTGTSGDAVTGTMDSDKTVTYEYNAHVWNLTNPTLEEIQTVLEYPYVTTVNANYTTDMALDEGATYGAIEVAEDQTLNITSISGAAVTNNREMIVDGELNVTGDVNLINNDIIDGTGTINVDDTATLTNSGNINVNSTNSLHVNGTLTNSGNINVGESSAGLMEVNGTLVFDGTGSIIVSKVGSLTLGGDVVINENATGIISMDEQILVNSGTITNNGTFTLPDYFVNEGEMTNNGVMYFYGTFENNSTMTNNGTLPATEGGSLLNNGTFEVAGGTVSANIRNTAGGSIIVSGGELAVAPDNSAGGNVEITGGTASRINTGTDGTLTVSGGTVGTIVTGEGSTVTVTGDGSVSGSDIGIDNTAGGSVTVSGGEVSGSYYGIYSGGGDVSVSGGTVTATGYDENDEMGTSGSAIYLTGGGTCTISDGTVEGYLYGVYNEDNTLTVEGGTISALDYTDVFSNGIGIFSGQAIAYEQPEGDQTAYNAYTLTVRGGTITGKNFGIVNYGIATVEDGRISGEIIGILNGTLNSISPISLEDNRYVLYVEGGTITGGTSETMSRSVARSEQYGIFSAFDSYLNISGGTITANSSLYPYEDGSFDKINACGVYTHTDCEVIVSDGTITGNGGLPITDEYGTYYTLGYGMTCYGSNVTIRNGDISGTYIGIHSEDSNLTVDNGTITGLTQDTWDIFGGCGISGNGGTLTVNDGTFTGYANGASLWFLTADINGGTFSSFGEENLNEEVSEEDFGNGIQCTYDCEITIDDAEVSGHLRGLYSHSNTSLVINSGTFTGTNYGVYNTATILQINGGTFTGIGGEDTDADGIPYELDGYGVCHSYWLESTDQVVFPTSLIIAGGTYSGSTFGLYSDCESMELVSTGTSPTFKVTSAAAGVDMLNYSFYMSNYNIINDDAEAETPAYLMCRLEAPTLEQLYYCDGNNYVYLDFVANGIDFPDRVMPTQTEDGTAYYYGPLEYVMG